ncbi:TolC family protein [Belliella kenyensis]|uniref:TolC family protein n=1 Tax=Belliella kenyensis TaxID=1472724 RepID=A0ABV8EQ70_9BACT|nr:efflux transporter outer membrane subunit [Belliella kenyensis]MCH7402149.1 efflux transporter outer membrane subunit [Belliella kenyensis]MDN3601664.1 efflux transporter outer membrane subunit [Belliella kenyensis]
MKIKYSIIAINLSVLLVMIGCSPSKITSASEDLGIPSKFEKVNETYSDSLNNAGLVHWKQYFEDENLKNLIQTALENNQDNLKTLESIRAARASFRMAKAGGLPEINAIAGASTRRFGEYTMDGVGNADSNLSPTVPADKMIPDPYRDFLLGAEFNWELDVWGKYRNRKKAAYARLMASEEMSNHVKTWLIAEVANVYYMLVGLDEELSILEKNIQIQNVAFNFAKEMKEAGKENQLAIDQFEALLINSKGKLVQRKREQRSYELMLSGLLGVYDFDHQRDRLDQVSIGEKLIQVGLPSQLINNRPDIRRAELELYASKADVAGARAAFFPSFNLFGMAGFNAFDFGKLFFNPASTVFQLGSGLSAPIFNRNSIRMGYEIANANQRIAMLDYEQVVFKSYLEVLDLVNAIELFDTQSRLKETEVEVQQRSVENSNIMFSVGYANYLDVTNAQQRALEAEIDRVELQVSQIQAKIKLYRALGGGWQ